MARYISENFVPIKIHVKENPDGFKRFKAQWTPTQIVLDSNASEKHRLEGFFAIDDFLGQLELGLAKLHFQSENYVEAEKRFREITEKHSASTAAPEATYWAGVSAYKASNDPEQLKQTGNLLKQKYPESEWAKKGSVWIP